MKEVYQAFDDELRNCQQCAATMAKFPVDPRRSEVRVEPRPIITNIRSKPIMLIGQAPGLTEYETGKPFQGGAGQEIRRIFEENGISRLKFDELVYSSAVVKCFPGSKPNLRSGKVREDALPSAQMIRNCQPFFEGQIKLVDPKIIVTLGGLPLKSYLKLRGRKTNEIKLENFVGNKEVWNGRTVIFFPHTSGASRWLNSSENRKLFQKAKDLLKSEVRGDGISSLV
jgi:uracil-DNA glycosylase